MERINESIEEMDGEPICGGIGSAKDVEAELKEWVKGFKSEVEVFAGETFDKKFEPVKYRSQIVAGTNYWFKVDVGDGKYIHVKMFEPLPYTNEPGEVESVEKGKTLEDPL